MANPNIYNVTDITGETEFKDIDTNSYVNLLSSVVPTDYVYKINTILAANVGTDNCTLNLSYYDGTNDHLIAHEIVIPLGSSLAIIGKDTPIYVLENHNLRAKRSGSDATITISYEKIKD
mgnify:CR=1 FL=1